MAGAGHEVPDWAVQRCTAHKHRDLLARAPDRLHEEIPNDCRDKANAQTNGEVMARRKAFLRKWRLMRRAVADSLEEAGDWPTIFQVRTKSGLPIHLRSVAGEMFSGSSPPQCTPFGFGTPARANPSASRCGTRPVSIRRSLTQRVSASSPPQWTIPLGFGMLALASSGRLIGSVF